MREREWLDTLEKPILVVGNGPLHRSVPEEKYASVVRFNNYTLGGECGQKITHWVASGYVDIQPHPISPVLIPWSCEYQYRPARYDLDFAKRIQSEVVHLSSTTHIRIWFPRALSRWKFFPSTGFCFLAWLYTQGLRPDIIGFDGLKSGHFADPDHQHGHQKTKDLEWQIIQSHLIRKRL